MTAFQALSQAANESSWMIGAAMVSVATLPLVPIIGPMDVIIVAGYLGSAAASASQGDYLGAMRKMVEGPGQILAAQAMAALMHIQIVRQRSGGPEHHIVSIYPNKSRGWETNSSAMSRRLLRRGKLGLESWHNKVRIPGHQGPHPEGYHRRVWEILEKAARDKHGGDLTTALEKALDRIALRLLDDPCRLSG